MQAELLHRRGVLATLAVGIVATVLAGPLSLFGQGSNEKTYFRGKPKGFKEGNPAAYYLWYDNAKWHLWTTTAGKLRKFEGTVIVKGGKFKGVFGANGEVKGKTVDRFDWKNDRMTFTFDTKGGADGISFQVDDDATEIEFVLKIDGKASPDQVNVGRQNQHPGGMPFTLPSK